MGSPRLRHPAEIALAGALILGAGGSAWGRVLETPGSALQLYSYRLSNPANKPVINGTILSKVAGSSTGTEAPDEWKEAYTRDITLNDGTTGTIFLLNDDDSLYVALIRPDNNNGDGIGTFLYFDQGAGGAGNADNQLTGSSATVRNEPGYGILRTSGVFAKQDLSWDGSKWAADADGATDFNGAASILGSATKVEAFEFAIPLNDGKAANGGNADLQINSLRQELGLFIRISRGGGDCDSCYWDKTNGKAGDPSSGSGWADVRLNVPHSFTTFYSSYARNGNPAIDGALTDDAWRGSYRRDIYLTNFNGKVIPATLYSIQDPAAKNIYLGLKIKDSVSNASDSLQVYFEEKAGDTTTARDYLLETGAEDATSAKGATMHDMEWTGSAWAADPEAADSHAAVGTFSNSIHQYEMRIPYQAGAQDIGVGNAGFPGFLIRYHDADQASGGQDFYWEYTVNSEAVRVNLQATPGIYVTSGWANFQLGAPYTQVVFPQDSAAVEGSVNLRLYAEGSGGVGDIDSVKFYRAADTSSKSRMAKIGNTGEWSGAWSVASLANGIDTLVFRTYANDGVFVDRLVVLNISNGGAVAAPPTVSFLSPSSGAEISGTQTLTFSASAGGGSSYKSYLVLDGADTVATSAAASHTLNTTVLAEGMHTVQIVVYNNNGASARTPILAFQVRNNPSVTWKTPAGGSVVSGRLMLDYAATPKGQATIATDSLFIDGHGFAALKAPSGPDTISIHALAEGAHAFEVKAWDSNGKTAASGPVTLQVHNGPWAFLTAPVGGTVLAGKAVLSYRDSAAAPATITADTLWVDGKASQALSLSGTDTLNTTAYLDGEHTLQVKATDNQGRSGASGLITVSLRNSPQAWLDSAFSDSTVSGTLVLRFRVSAVAPATVASREVSLDGAGFHAAKGDSTDTVDTRMLSEGAHTAQVKVTDSRGKTGLSRLVKFNVRNAPSIAVVGPSADAYVKGTVTVRLQARAVGPDTIAKVLVSVAGGAWSDAPTDSTFVLDTRGYKDGDVLVQALAVDGSGKRDTSLAVELVIDNSPPKLSYPRIVYGAASQGRKGGAMVATVQAIDLKSGMNKDSAVVLTSKLLTGGSSLLLKDDGKGADSVAGDNVYSAYLTVPADVNGPAAYAVRGRDALGNDTLLQSQAEIDNRPPVADLHVDPKLGGEDGLTGEVYVPKITLKGAYSDSGSGIASAVVAVLNDSGRHVQNSPIALSPAAGSFSRVAQLVPGRNRVYLIVADKAGNADTVAATVTYVIPKATALVPASGGRVSSPNGASVLIPPGAMGQAAEITIRPADPSQEAKPRNPLVRLLGVPNEFGPDHTVFRSSVQITLAYTEADLDTNQDGQPDLRPEDLTLVFWDGSTWVRAGEASLNASDRTLTVSVNHFTLFDIASDKTPKPEKLVAFWSNNPVRESQGSVFHYNLPEPGAVSLDILDLSGDVVAALIPKGTARDAGEWSWEWKGDNVVNRFAGSGLYVYVFRFAPSSGASATLIRKPIGLVRK